MRTMQSSFYFNAGFNYKKSEIQNNGITHRLYRDKCQFVLDSVASEIPASVEAARAGATLLRASTRRVAVSHINIREKELAQRIHVTDIQ